MKTSIFVCTLLFMHGWMTGFSQSVLQRNPSDSIRVMKLICESDQYMWIGTNIGLIRRTIQTGKEWLICKENSKLRSNEITCGVCLPDGTTYIGTKDELLYWNNDILIQITSENSDLAKNHIKELIVDQKQNVWVKTINGRVGKLTGMNIRMLKSGNHTRASSDLEIKSQVNPLPPKPNSLVFSRD